MLLAERHLTHRAAGRNYDGCNYHRVLPCHHRVHIEHQLSIWTWKCLLIYATVNGLGVSDEN